MSTHNGTADKAKGKNHGQSSSVLNWTWKQYFTMNFIMRSTTSLIKPQCNPASFRWLETGNKSSSSQNRSFTMYLTKSKICCLNTFKKPCQFSLSHTNGHPVVVPMATALNHAMADGSKAGGLNLSPSILPDYRVSAWQAKVPPFFPKILISLDRRWWTRKSQYQNLLFSYLDLKKTKTNAN